MYNKLFTKILDSSIWLAPDPHRLVWITLVAAMDEDAIAHFACAENLAARARVSIPETESALAAFLAPDPHGPDQEFEGRRIERVPGGWYLLNGLKYRSAVTRSAMQEQNRERVRRWREKHRVTTEKHSNVTVMHAEALAEAEDKQKNPTARKAAPDDPEWFSEFKSVYPPRAGDQGWRKALRAANARILEGHAPSEFVAGARRYAAFIAATDKAGSEYVKQAATFLGPDKPFLLAWNAPTEPETAMEEIKRLNGGSHGKSIFEAEPSRPALGASGGNVRGRGPKA